MIISVHLFLLSYLHVDISDSLNIVLRNLNIKGNCLNNSNKKTEHSETSYPKHGYDILVSDMI